MTSRARDRAWKGSAYSVRNEHAREEAGARLPPRDVGCRRDGSRTSPPLLGELGARCPAGDYAPRRCVAVLRSGLPVAFWRRTGELGLQQQGDALAGHRGRAGRCPPSPLLPDPPLRAVDLRRFGVGIKVPFCPRRMALYTGHLPPRQETLLGARGDHSGALSRGALCPYLLQPGSPLLLDADSALHPHLLLLVGSYSRPALPPGIAGGRRRPVRRLRRTLRLPALLRAAPCHIARRRTGGARVPYAAHGDTLVPPRSLRLPALATEHDPPVRVWRTERGRGADPPGPARLLPVPLRPLGLDLARRVDAALLLLHPRLGRPAAPPEGTRNPTGLAARRVGSGIVRRGLRDVAVHAHGREPTHLTARRLPPPRALRNPHVLGQGGGDLPGDRGHRAGRCGPRVPALLDGLLHHPHQGAGPRGRPLRRRPRRQGHPARPLRHRQQARLLPEDQRDGREKRRTSL